MRWCVEQVKLIREKFQQALGEEGARMVDINTIDGFQVHLSSYTQTPQKTYINSPVLQLTRLECCMRDAFACILSAY